jgi:hypothetical protein
VDDQTAPVELHVDVFGDVHTRQLEAHHRVVTVRDDLGGWMCEAVKDALLNPTVDVPRGSSPQRHVAHVHLLGLVMTGTTPVRDPMELESTSRTFQQRVRTQ